MDWFFFCCKVAIHYCKTNSKKINGPGVEVEIDENKFGKRNHNTGRVIDGQWVFGRSESLSKKMFLVDVPDRMEKTLTQLIQDWIHPGTVISSDCWCSYSKLRDLGYDHTKIIHSQNSIDPESGASTKNTECKWRDVNVDVQKYSRSAHFDGYLAVALFKRCFPDTGQ